MTTFGENGKGENELINTIQNLISAMAELEQNEGLEFLRMVMHTDGSGGLDADLPDGKEGVRLFSWNSLVEMEILISHWDLNRALVMGWEPTSDSEGAPGEASTSP